MITIHQRHRRTDRQTTSDRKTALCTKVHRAVKKTGRGRTCNCMRRRICEMKGCDGWKRACQTATALLVGSWRQGYNVTSVRRLPGPWCIAGSICPIKDADLAPAPLSPPVIRVTEFSVYSRSVSAALPRPLKPHPAGKSTQTHPSRSECRDNVATGRR